jgi:SsrA-binding protein
MKTKSEKDVCCTNRKALHEYFVLDTLEAGIMLKGTEIKSLRGHKVSLDGAYAKTDENGEVWLIGCNIEVYTHGNHSNHEPKRDRKLLLRKSEIAKFAGKAQQAGHTLIPLSVYIFKGKAKVQLAVCKGKQLHDKRQSIKEKDMRRSMED